jgi:hypothetical protein
LVVGVVVAVVVVVVVWVVVAVEGGVEGAVKVEFDASRCRPGRWVTLLYRHMGDAKRRRPHKGRCLGKRNHRWIYGKK